MKDNSDKIHGTQRLLLADDQPEILSLLAPALRKAGYEVITVENGEEACLAVEKNDFAMAFLDIEMPKMTGWEAVREMRDVGEKMPIYAISSHSSSEKIQRSLLAGFDGHVVKAQSFVGLEEALMKLIDSHTQGTLNQKRIEQASESALSVFERGLKRFPEDVKAIRQKLDEADWEGCRRLVHQLKGTSAMCGFEEISQRASQFEELLELPEKDLLTAKLREIERTISRSQKEFKAVLSSSGDRRKEK